MPKKQEPEKQPPPSSLDAEAFESLQTNIRDIVDVEPKSFGNDKQASEGAAWIQFAKATEEEANELLEPAIKQAFTAHRELTGAKKKLLERLEAAKSRVRMNLANWIAGGHDVKGCYIQRKFKVTVDDQEKLPEEYLVTTVDQKALDEWAQKTEGKVPIPGCTIDQVNVLFSREAE